MEWELVGPLPGLNIATNLVTKTAGLNAVNVSLGAVGLEPALATDDAARSLASLGTTVADNVSHDVICSRH